MEPYNYKSNSFYNDDKSWEGLNERTANVTYPTTHLSQRPHFIQHNKNPNSTKYSDNFQKPTNPGNGKGFQYWHQESGGNDRAERDQRSESPSGWRQVNYSQHRTRSKSPDTQRDMSYYSKRISTSGQSRSTPLQGSKDGFSGPTRSIDIDYAHSRRSPISTPQIDYRTSERSPEVDPKQQQYREYDAPHYNSRKSHTRDSRIQDSSPKYGSRREFQNRNLNKSPKQNFRGDYEINRPHNHPSSESEVEENYLDDIQRYSGRNDFNSQSVSNLQTSFQFSDSYSSHNNQRFNENMGSSDRTSRALENITEFTNQSTYQNPMSFDETGSFSNPVSYNSPSKLTERFNRPTVKSSDYLESSNYDPVITSIQKRKAMVDEGETFSKRSRIQSPSTIHRTNKMPVSNSFRQKITAQNMEPFKLPNVEEKRKTLSMAEEYIKNNLNFKSNNIPVDHSFRKKNFYQNNKQLYKWSNTGDKTKPLSMAEQYVKNFKSNKMPDSHSFRQKIIPRNEKQPFKPPNVGGKTKPLSMAEEYVKSNLNRKANNMPIGNSSTQKWTPRTKTQSFKSPNVVEKTKPLSMPKAFVNKIKNKTTWVKPLPPPIEENVSDTYEIILVPKSFPFYRFKIEQIEELKLALLGDSEKHQFSVTCRKKARLLHFKCSNEKDIDWLNNAYKKFSPWKGVELKIIRINYNPPRPIAIYTNAFSNFGMTHDQMNKLSDLLAAEMLECPNDICIEMVELVRRRGKVIVYCNNKESSAWLLAKKRDFKQFEGGKLIMSSALALPPFFICEFLLPKSHKDVEKALARLERQNDYLNTQTWYIMSKFESDTGIKLTVSVETDALKSLEMLEFKPFLDFGRIECSFIGPMKNVKEKFSVPTK